MAFTPPYLIPHTSYLVPAPVAVAGDAAGPQAVMSTLQLCFAGLRLGPLALTASVLRHRPTDGGLFAAFRGRNLMTSGPESLDKSVT